MEEINEIAHFAKWSMILKNHYVISYPQRRIPQLIGNAISSSAVQEPPSDLPSPSLSLYRSPLSDKPLPLGESVDDNPTGQDGMLPEKKIKRPLSSSDLLEEKKVFYVKGNNTLAILSESSDAKVTVLNVENSQKGMKFKKTFKIQKGIKSKQADPVSSKIQLKQLTSSFPGVRAKHVDLLPPEYLTAILNNAQVVKIKHPSLLPSSLPTRNPSQVSSNSDSIDFVGFLSNSDHESEFASEFFSSDSHVSEEKTDLIN
jgi:hypothetical protein